jgi:hypothetical protein
MDVLVAFHDELMGPCNLLELILMEELISDISPPGPACTSGADSPTGLGFVWVTPEKITHGAIMRHVLEAVELFDLFY